MGVRILLVVLACTCEVAAKEPIPGVTAVATSAQVAGLFSANNLCNDNGLTDAGKGDGSRKLTTNVYADSGCMWQSGYRGERGPDEHPILEFAFPQKHRVGSVRVWNHNGQPTRGLQRVSVTYSIDGKNWASLARPLEFAKAPKSEDYLGEFYTFDTPIEAKFIRFFTETTHRVGGNADLAGLGKVRFYEAQIENTPAEQTKDTVFPVGTNVVSVKQPPFLAQGNGIADDTNALQAAIDATQGSHRIVYLPPGTYLISRPLRYQPGKGNGYNNFRGAGRAETTIRLKESVMPDNASPQPVLTLAYNGQPDGKGVHADWFNCNVSDLTIDTGRNNPGAIGLQFYSNNVGSLRNVSIVSPDSQGLLGLDLGYADQNGPLLVSQVNIAGFATGIRTGATVNSQTLEHVSIAGAVKLGWENAGQCLAVRGLKYRGAAPAFHNKLGIVALLDAHLEGNGETKNVAAIINHEGLFARNIKTEHFRRSIEDQSPASMGGHEPAQIDEFVTPKPLNLFPQRQTRSLHLDVEETPEMPYEPVDRWANIRHFRQMSDPDDSAAIQRAIDSGASTVFFPAGSYLELGETIVVRGTVQQINGLFSHVRQVSTGVSFRIEGNEPGKIVRMEAIKGDILIDHASSGTLVVRDGQGMNGKLTGGGKLFLENVVADWTFEQGKAWARQLNNEREGTHLLNHGATLWILGYKTERGGTLIETRDGGATELLGGLSYTTTKGQLAPMFVSSNARVSYVFGEVCYTGNPFRELVQETRGTETKLLSRGQAPLRPSYLQGSFLPLFVGDP